MKRPYMISQAIPMVCVKKKLNFMIPPYEKTRECFFSGYIPFYLSLTKV
jgi:hypothetical protein